MFKDRSVKAKFIGNNLTVLYIKEIMNLIPDALVEDDRLSEHQVMELRTLKGNLMLISTIDTV
jgi:hypothetical protein